MRLAIQILACSALGCRVTTIERAAAPQAEIVRQSAPTRAWTVLAGEVEIGRVVLFEAVERPEAPVFVVQDALGHDLGMVDGLGRAWRFRPHQREAEWLSTGTIQDGAAAILGAPDARLEDLPLEASAPR